jgi:hypothetical protein
MDLPMWRQVISPRIEPFETQYNSKCDDVALQFEASTGHWPTYSHWEQFQRYVQGDAGRLTAFILGTDTDMARLVRESIEAGEAEARWVWDRDRDRILPVEVPVERPRPTEVPTEVRVPGAPRTFYKLAAGTPDLSGLSPAVIAVFEYLGRVESAPIQTVMAECLLGRSTVMNALVALRQRQAVETIPAGAIAA